MEEHIIIEDLGNQYIKILPEEGYKLFNIPAQRFVSEAVIKRENIKNFTAFLID